MPQKSLQNSLWRRRLVLPTTLKVFVAFLEKFDFLLTFPKPSLRTFQACFKTFVVSATSMRVNKIVEEVVVVVVVITATTPTRRRRRVSRRHTKTHITKTCITHTIHTINSADIDFTHTHTHTQFIPTSQTSQENQTIIQFNNNDNDGSPKTHCVLSNPVKFVDPPSPGHSNLPPSPFGPWAFGAHPPSPLCRSSRSDHPRAHITSFI